MFVSGKQFLACAILLTIVDAIAAEYNVDGFCTMVRDGTKLSSIDSCHNYYYCENGRGIHQSCPSGESFDRNSQSCRSSRYVECYYGVQEPCAGKYNGFVPIMGTCNGWIYCSGHTEVTRGSCGVGMIFRQNQCVYGACSNGANIDNGKNGLQSVCDIMPANIYFGSTMDCNTWQICKNGKLDTGSCPKKMVFDVQQVVCNYEEDGSCVRVNGQTIQPDEDKPQACLPGQQGQLKGDSGKCSIFYKCTNKLWTKFQCPAGQFFDVVQSLCVARQRAQTTTNCDRCAGTKRTFVNAVDSKCRKYYVCTKGFKTGAGSCAANTYFDEAEQGCVIADENKSQYVARNGACATDNDNNNNNNSNVNNSVCQINQGICKCSDANANPCNCGLDSGSCVLCASGVAKNGSCAPVQTQQVCTNDASNCKCTDASKSACNCGVDSGKCVECPNGIDNNGDCV